MSVTCHRCGCPESLHRDHAGEPSRCHGECGVDCPAFRDKGEDMSSLNRLLHTIRREAGKPRKEADHHG